MAQLWLMNVYILTCVAHVDIFWRCYCYVLLEKFVLLDCKSGLGMSNYFHSRDIKKYFKRNQQKSSGKTF